MDTYQQVLISTPMGPITFYTTDEGVRLVLFEGDQRYSIEGVLPGYKRRPGMDWPVVAQMEEYLAGTRQVFDLPFMQHGTAFQQAVWSALTEIPYGQVITYEELAKRVGRPRAYRAVGSTNGRNRISILVPCHRVVRAGGELGGYAGGVEMKRFLVFQEREVLLLAKRTKSQGDCDFPLTPLNACR